MFRLASVLYAIIGTSLAGMFVVATLVSGTNSAQTIVMAAALGFAVGLPAAWLVAKKIDA